MGNFLSYCHFRKMKNALRNYFKNILQDRYVIFPLKKKKKKICPS